MFVFQKLGTVLWTVCWTLIFLIKAYSATNKFKFNTARINTTWNVSQITKRKSTLDSLVFFYHFSRLDIKLEFPSSKSSISSGVRRVVPPKINSTSGLPLSDNASWASRAFTVAQIKDVLMKTMFSIKVPNARNQQKSIQERESLRISDLKTIDASDNKNQNDILIS